MPPLAYSAIEHVWHASSGSWRYGDDACDVLVSSCYGHIHVFAHACTSLTAAICCLVHALCGCCRRQLSKWRRTRKFVCLLVEEVDADDSSSTSSSSSHGSSDGSSEPSTSGRVVATATLSMMQVNPNLDRHKLVRFNMKHAVCVLKCDCIARIRCWVTT
jgi:hypothetical protein